MKIAKVSHDVIEYTVVDDVVYGKILLETAPCLKLLASMLGFIEYRMDDCKRAFVEEAVKSDMSGRRIPDMILRQPSMTGQR